MAPCKPRDIYNCSTLFQMLVVIVLFSLGFQVKQGAAFWRFCEDGHLLTGAAAMSCLIFQKSSEMEIYGNAEPVSAKFACHAGVDKCSQAIKLGLTKTETFSIGGNLGVTAGADIKKAATISIGYSWATAVSLDQTHTTTFFPGQTVYMTFRPKYKVLMGTLTKKERTMTTWGGGGTIVHTGPVTIKHPVQLPNGQLDGILHAVIEGQRIHSSSSSGQGGTGTGGRCRARSDGDRFDLWCRTNCAQGYCPRDICVC